MNIHIQGENFVLLHERALLWPRLKLLALADMHLGKVSSFSEHGYWLPEQAEINDIERLADLIATHSIESVLFLGDLSHSFTAVSPTVCERFAQLPYKFPRTHFTLLHGNHDSAGTDRWPPEWNFVVRVDQVVIDRFGFAHQADKDAVTDQAHFTWYGHVHPVVKLVKGPERLRLPAFWLENYRGCLPAFSSLAGGFEIPSKKKNRLFAVTDTAVIAL